jgi:proline iminopeptidase
MKRILIVAALIFPGSSAFAAGPEPGQGFVDVPGGPVWYKVTGTGPGLPILALHGGPGGTSCGYSLLEALGDERPVIRYDQLGSGRSGRPDDLSLWEVDRFVEALHTLRKKLGLDEFHLIGGSWGGALAAAYVIEKGTEGVVSVTLSSPLLSTPDWIEDANYLRSQMPQDIQDMLTRHEEAGTLDTDEYREATREFYARHVSYGERQEESTGCDGVTGSSLIYNYMWGPTEFRATGNLIDFDVTGRLHEIDTAVLIIGGEFDEARPERLAEYQKLIPGSQHVVIKEAAHATLSRKPTEYRAILEAFLDAAEAGHK